MEYSTYWSILETPSNSTTSGSIFLILSILSLISLSSIIIFKKSGFEKKLLLVLNGLFLFLSIPAFIYLTFFVEDNTEKRITSFLNSNRVKIVEGKISNYERNVIIPRNGKSTTESFNVDSVKFEYMENTLYEFNHFGGNHSATLHDGLNVKITYQKGLQSNEIQKIEIKK